MSGTSVIKQKPDQRDLRDELCAFLSAANSNLPSENQADLMRKSLNLLTNLPASRDAVFDHLASIYEKALVEQLIVMEDKSTKDFLTPPESSLLVELHSFLNQFVLSSSVTWALVTSKWTLEVLGMLCSKYSNRGKCPVNGSLGDSLSQWTCCQATRSLMDINIECLRSLVGTKFEATAIYNLLDTCVIYTPHFDWAVAMVGSHFPNALTKRVFTWGLQDFLANDGNPSRPKMISLVGILSHLAGCYSTEIQNVMCNLIAWSEEKECDFKDLTLDKGGCVPFLLQLSSSSPFLLNAFSKGPFEKLRVEDLPLHIEYGERWCRLLSGAQPMLNLVVRYILSNDQSPRKVIEMLTAAVTHSNRLVATTSEDVLELLLKEIDIICRTTGDAIPFLNGLGKEVNWVMSLLLKEPEIYPHTATVLLNLLAIQQKGLLARSISYLIRCSVKDDHLVAVVRLTQSPSGSAALTEAISMSLGPAVSVSIHQKDIAPEVMWNNLNKLLKWEGSGTLACLPMEAAVRSNLTAVATKLAECSVVSLAKLIADVASKALSDDSSLRSNRMSRPPIGVQQTIALIRAIVKYFYLCLRTSEGTDRILNMRLITRLLVKLCENNSFARSVFVRDVLECAMFKAESKLFGGKQEVQDFISRDHQFSLLEENYKQGNSYHRSHSTSLTTVAGVKRPATFVSKDDVTLNTRMLMQVLTAACHSDSQEGFVDAMGSVALLLVELVSPDVMFNGLPWPEEDFCKVTVERDLAIKRLLANSPLVWSLLTFIAYYRPALCYCSVILRAMVATLIGEWTTASQQGREAKECLKLIQETSKLLQIMSLGQLLPSPLSAISEIVYYLEPSQVVNVLKECVWSYLRDNVPAPAHFTRDPQGCMWRDTATWRPPKQYTEPLRLAILANIDSLPTLYKALFINENIEEE